MRALLAAALLLLAACGPQIGDLERGEEGRVVRVFGGDTLLLEDGTRVFLAEIDAPGGDAAYASQSQGELEALALHRDVLLAYGGERRWIGRQREGEAAPREAAIAHVFVKSEGGRWFWLQHELVSRGAGYVRARSNNHARTDELLAIEARARTAERGMWALREYKPYRPQAVSLQALAFGESCMSGRAPVRTLEATVANVLVDDGRAALFFGPEGDPFHAVLFGQSFSAWDGPDLDTLRGSRVRIRGPIGAFRQSPQICLEHSSQLEVLTD